MLMEMSEPSFSKVGRKGDLSPAALFPFPRVSVMSTGKSQSRFTFWLYFRSRAQTCSLLAGVKLLSVWYPASVQNGPSFEGTVFPALS